MARKHPRDHKFAPDPEGHETEKVIEAIHKDSGDIRGPVVPFKMLSTILTIAAGGAAGKEGPSAHIGLTRFRKKD